MLAAQDTQISKQQYLDYCISTANHLNGELVSFRTKWLERHKPDRSKGYAPPDREIYLAALNANLFRITGDEKYLIPVKDILLHYGEYKRHYPPDFHLARIEYGSSLPALPQAFSMRRYVSAYITLKGAAPLGEKETEIIENNIAESADYLMRIQEWGPMNRAIICAEGLGLAAMALPQHAHAAEWKKMAGIIAEDNFRILHMEDSQKYLLIWMYSMIHYAVDVHGDEMLLSQPMFSKWFGYLLDIFSPAGLIPDYGDADWGSSRFLCLPIFEEGAKLLKKGELRWAAARVFNKWIPGNPDNVHIAMVASDACLWADFELGGSKPGGMAGTAPDWIAKKIVFRSGWEDKSTYLLLNYRDEDDDAGVFLHYLRSTLAVNEEKLHHGHADENSICLLMKNGSVLLHDGGYRDGIPSGKYGAYRADYFHNRAVVRRIPAKKAEGVNLGKGLLANIHNNGAYIKSQTEKTDHLIKGAFEMSRTRSMYPGNGYIYDRVLVYL
ncbi:MAG: hypothetical protein ACE5DN_06190, partial [Flavobacteriales bacterium]